jgi:hypothetical protein
MNKSKSKKDGKQVRDRRIVPVPPVFKSEIILARKLRFKASSAVSEVSIRHRDIAMAFGIVAVTTTTSGILVWAHKLLKIDLWFTAATAGTPVEGVVDWNSSPGTSFIAGPGSSKSAVATSTAEYAYLSVRPPKLSQQDCWHKGDDTASAFTLTLPAGGILDITAEVVLNDSNAVLSGDSITGGTIGTWYHKQPDPNLIIMGNLNTIA